MVATGYTLPGMKSQSVIALAGVGLGLGLAAYATTRKKSTPETPKEPTFLRYSDDVEQIAPGEEQMIGQLLASTHRIFERDEAKFGRPLRVSHAKSHGVAVGELEILDGLPAPYRQGLFAQAGRHPVAVRMSNVPGEIVTDAVNTQRGFAIKIFNVAGEKLPGHSGQTTQDFVFDSGGNRFPAMNLQEFLVTHLNLEHAPQMPDSLKVAVSTAARGANSALHAVGVDSARLDLYGHPLVPPLAESYFSQAAIRYGDNIAKIAIVPVSPEQKALAETKLDVAADPNALRTATVDYLNANEARFEVRVQLCTDLHCMPIEDVNKEWSADESPFVTVAHLKLPKQNAYSDARRAYFDDALSFSPAHSLAAHRPLGSIMRARLRAYPEMSSVRRNATGRNIGEPASIDDIPV